MVRIGVLALQGGISEHVAALTRLGAVTVPVRRPVDLAGLDAIVLPGGESTVFDKLARAFGLAGPLAGAIADGLPVLATCAGLIYLAARVEDAAEGQQTLGALDVTVRRNAFGTQLDSFETSVRVRGLDAPVPATFIRAPLVTWAGPQIEVISRLEDGRIIGVRQGAVTGYSFHPEETGDDRLHRVWLESVTDPEAATPADLDASPWARRAAC
ncbi:pyridoxal 5'-phosphate synthase glutaminase subunit PdxT [Acidipropionibacterium virtanenii]|uniref:Pyridoxal 5'-phosphate synthase subunit PdxT n=1 Tax=Acidipropionibacterium virtanenii TaxID=2057246 RepID=A0A344UUR9_9ACTN|nr:pyridoxal 5'-phosphate synthase glutaminase subunit PdxT [Acidipropionibacterium virtanenii]AXE39017.1 Pyridoxal 5'-phosphate synthase subunit PdxT [Acidipropionibacterium virtanenii]